LNKKPSLLTIINSIVLLSALLFAFFYYLENNHPRTVYLDNVAVFSNFNLAKDLNTIHQKDLNLQKKRVDSFVTILQNTTKSSPNENLQKQFIFENNKLKEMGEYFTNEVSQQVWSRVNSYVKEFGEQNNYSIVFGTQGNGNIMYADKKLDITTAFIEFANKKYEGE
jgi:outer membrane protein